ncbi:MAG: extracellular solute-binding protein [Lautropia sp.]
MSAAPDSQPPPTCGRAARAASPAMRRAPALRAALRAVSRAVLRLLVPPSLVMLAASAVLVPGAAHAAHAIAWGATPKYPPGFAHFDYVNPDAPRTGSVDRDGFGSFDKLNPFTLRGIAAAGLGDLMFETLAEPSWDEPMSAYGLLAEDIDFAKDGLSITFRLRPEARFSNGDPVTAADVRHSFETLTGKYAHPRFAQYFADVAAVRVLGEREVRFEFRQLNHELHMILAMQLPIFSAKWGGGARFDTIVQQPPLASGPYRIESVDFGKTISYLRRDDYWGWKLAVRAGAFNFERITYKYFKDETARLEGFKAGEFDWIFENSAKNWARGHTGRAYRDGELIKRQFAHSNVAGMQGFAMNMRRPRFKDVRVRRALALAFDFEWMNRQVFFNQYTRTASYYANSAMAATGRPEGTERAFLDAVFRAVGAKAPGAVPAERVDTLLGEVPMPPDTNPPGSLRENLREALRLLGEAGWKVADDGWLRDGQGNGFEFEVLSYSTSLERIAVPWVRNLAKLGIRVNLRTTDPALYQKRLDEFDFDVTTHVFGASQTPGNELLDMFVSASADRPGSSNLPGIKDPVVDAIVEQLLRSKTRDELVIRARALDRVLRHGWYMVPHFHSTTHRVAFRRALAFPTTLPDFYSADAWMLRYWWRR